MEQHKCEVCGREYSRSIRGRKSNTCPAPAGKRTSRCKDARQLLSDLEDLRLDFSGQFRGEFIGAMFTAANQSRASRWTS
jgi:hypothetical protein